MTGSIITTNGIFAHGIYAIGLDNPTTTASPTTMTINGASSSATEALQCTISVEGGAIKAHNAPPIAAKGVRSVN